MDVFFMIRCKKTTLFIDTKETSLVLELKKMIEGILKVSPENQLLLKDESEQLPDHKTLADCGLNASTARAQTPAVLGLCVRQSCESAFSQLEVEPYTQPPELPDVMKAQESTTGGHGQTGEQTAAQTIRS